MREYDRVLVLVAESDLVRIVAVAVRVPLVLNVKVSVGEGVVELERDQLTLVREILADPVAECDLVSLCDADVVAERVALLVSERLDVCESLIVRDVDGEVDPLREADAVGLRVAEDVALADDVRVLDNVQDTVVVKEREPVLDTVSEVVGE